MKRVREWLKVCRGPCSPTWGAVWLEVGRLRLIRCAPARQGSPGHPNSWMIVWRRGLPEWDRQSWERLRQRRLTPEAQAAVGCLPDWLVQLRSKGHEALHDYFEKLRRR
jgi:hypothetical protein